MRLNRDQVVAERRAGGPALANGLRIQVFT